MKLLCCFCDTPIFLDLSNDKLARAELEMYQQLECKKNPDPDPENRKHKFSKIQ
jgi:hypothetical protein